MMLVGYYCYTLEFYIRYNNEDINNNFLLLLKFFPLINDFFFFNTVKCLVHDKIYYFEFLFFFLSKCQFYLLK